VEAGTRQCARTCANSFRALGPDGDGQAATTEVTDAVTRLVPPDRFVDMMPVAPGDDELLARARELGVRVGG
jgi:hypothetical protein